MVWGYREMMEGVFVLDFGFTLVFLLEVCFFIGLGGWIVSGSSAFSFVLYVATLSWSSLGVRGALHPRI